MPRSNPFAKFFSSRSGGVLMRGERRTMSENGAAPLGGTNQEALKRLQIGGAGVGVMLLLVGLASAIENRASLADARTVPEAAPTVEPTQSAEQNDPLAKAGVVPDLPAEKAAPEPEAAQPVMPSEPARDDSE